MQIIKFKLEGEYIELIQLLKVAKIAQSGGHAKLMVEEGAVIFNEKIEDRKRAKIRKGDFILVEGKKRINVI